MSNALKNGFTEDAGTAVWLVLLSIGCMFYIPWVLHYCWNSFFAVKFALPELTYYMVFSVNVLFQFIRVRISDDSGITIKDRIETLYAKYFAGLLCVALFYFM